MMKISHIIATILLIGIVFFGGYLYYYSQVYPEYFICEETARIVDLNTNNSQIPYKDCSDDLDKRLDIYYIDGQKCAIANIPSCQNGTYLSKINPIYGFIEHYQITIFIFLLIFTFGYHYFERKSKKKPIFPKIDQ